MPNQAPSTAANSITIAEDSAYIFKAQDFKFIDADSADQLSSVSITALPKLGSLRLVGVDVALNQRINISDILAGKLVFTPNANRSGYQYTDFQFKVSDGTELSAPASFTVNVMPSNDAPSFRAGTGKVTTSLEFIEKSKALAVQTDGKLLVLGYSWDNNQRLNATLLRLNQDGSLDPSFNGNGSIPNAFFDLMNTEGLSVKTQSTGKIILTGVSSSNTSYMARFSLDGGRDPFFEFIPSAKLGSVKDIYIQADDKILMVGTGISQTSPQFALEISLSRFNANGSIDTSFNSTGTIRTHVETSNTDTGSAVAVQSNGKIIIGGSSLGSPLVMRLNADGSQDVSFHQVGSYLLKAPSIYGEVKKIVVQNDDKIVIMGVASPSTYIARFNVDGSLDTSFQSLGYKLFDFDSSFEGRSVRIQSDGKILIVGTTFENTTNYSNFAILRLNPDGSFDTTFNKTGYLQTDFDHGVDDAVDLSILADGRIVVLGTNTFDYAIARYNADGSPDLSFNQQSTFNSETRKVDANAVITLEPTAKIFDEDATATNYGGSKLSIERSNGVSTEDVFGGTGSLQLTNGKVIVDGKQIGEYGDRTGKLVIHFNEFASQDLVNATIQQITYKNTNANLSQNINLIWNFDDGSSTTNAVTKGETAVSVNRPTNLHLPTTSDRTINIDEDQAYTLQLQDFPFADGDANDQLQNVLITAPANSGMLRLNGVNLTQQRLVSAADILDGKLVYIPAADQYGQAISQISFKVNDGAGFSNLGSLRLTIQSINDAPSFQVGKGFVTTAMTTKDDMARAIAIQNDGKLLIAGSTTSPIDFATHTGIARYLANGAVDSSFNGNGQLIIEMVSHNDYDYVTDMAVQSDGKIITVGPASKGDSSQFAIARYNIDGSLDSSFNGVGKLLVPISKYDTAESVLIQSDGKILVGGSSQFGAMAVIRINPNGSLDDTFNSTGKTTLKIGNDSSGLAMATDANGKILIAGPNDVYRGFAIGRLNIDGTPDLSFNGTGKAATTVGSSAFMSAVLVQNDGKIILVGSTGVLFVENSKITIVRYNPDGSLDTSFGVGGIQKIDPQLQQFSTSSAKLLADGKILVAGTGNQDMIVSRLLSNGTLDTSFGVQGIQRIDLGNTDDRSVAMEVLANGKIVITGQSTADRFSDFALVQLNADGSLDTQFNPSSHANIVTNFVHGMNAVIVDPQAAIYDTELLASNSYAGTTLSISHQSGSRYYDEFVGSGSLQLSNKQVFIGGTNIGDYLQQEGNLQIHFNQFATPSFVNQAISQIAYRNNDLNFTGKVPLNWSFDDGSGKPNAIVTQASEVDVKLYEHDLSSTKQNESFIGGQYLDRISFQEKIAQYKITKNGLDYTVLSKSGIDGQDQLRGIEHLRFQDLSIDLTIQTVASQANPSHVQKLCELYVAFFNRVPDASGLKYWLEQMQAGQSLAQIAESFYQAGIEAPALTGYSPGMSNTDFINIVYRNTLGRAEGADAEGLAYWNLEISSGKANHGLLVSTILDSAHSTKDSAQWGWVANLLDNKISVANTVAIEWGVNFNTAAESITNGMRIAAAITPTDTKAALELVGIHAADISIL